MTAVAPRHLALLLAITLLWGFNLIASKSGLAELPPITFTLLRFAIVAVLLWPFLRPQRGQMGALVVAALLTGGLHFALMFAGIRLATNVSAIAIVSQLGVPFTTLLSMALLGEVVRWRRWSGITLAFGGVLVMALDPRILEERAGLAFVIASAFVGSLGLITVKKLRGFAPFELQAWIAWISLPPLLGLALWIEQPTWELLAELSVRTWAAIAYTAVAATVIAHTGFYYLVQRYPVTSVAPLTVLSPVFSVVFGVWLLGDVLTPRLVLGGALTLCGVAIISLRERRIIDTGT
jgi:O-acetylserine/cysteine efflux transporter